MTNVLENNDDVVTAALFTFPSSHHAFRAENICQEANLPVLLIPLPAEIGTDCGVALIFSPKLRERAEALLNQAGVTPAGSFQITRERRRARLWQRVLNID